MGAVRVAAQLPGPEWRVASAQKLSWAALRGSAGFPGTHACARTWPTACADSSRRRRGFSAPFRRRRAANDAATQASNLQAIPPDAAFSCIYMHARSVPVAGVQVQARDVTHVT